jgi:hypothetical protein
MAVPLQGYIMNRLKAEGVRRKEFLLDVRLAVSLMPCASNGGTTSPVPSKDLELRKELDQSSYLGFTEVLVSSSLGVKVLSGFRGKVNGP